MKTTAGVLAAVCLLLGSGCAQEMPSHRFFDKENVTLFSLAAVSRAMDCQSTWQFRRYGTDEANLSNGLVDNKPLFAAYSLGAVGLNVAVSYGLHRVGWHHSERMLSIFHVTYETRTDLHNYEHSMTTKKAGDR